MGLSYEQPRTRWATVSHVNHFLRARITSSKLVQFLGTLVTSSTILEFTSIYKHGGYSSKNACAVNKMFSRSKTMALRVRHILRYNFLAFRCKLLRTETNQHVKDKAANGLASKILNEFLNYR